MVAMGNKDQIPPQFIPAYTPKEEKPHYHYQSSQESQRQLQMGIPNQNHHYKGGLYADVNSLEKGIYLLREWQILPKTANNPTSPKNFHQVEPEWWVATANNSRKQNSAW